MLMENFLWGILETMSSEQGKWYWGKVEEWWDKIEGPKSEELSI